MADCKGSSAIIFGSTLELLVRMPDLGKSRQERLDKVRVFMKKWYDDHPGHHRLPELRLGNIRADDKWAELHGVTVKAANTRAAAPIVQRLGLEVLHSRYPGA